MTAGIDQLREKFPHLGFAVYAYGPGSAVTLEVVTPGGGLDEIRRPTLAACIAEAFPEPEPKEPDAFG